MTVPHSAQSGKDGDGPDPRSLLLYTRVLDAVVGTLIASSRVTFADVQRNIRIGDVIHAVMEDLIAAGVIGERPGRGKRTFLLLDRDEAVTALYALARRSAPKPEGGAR